MCLWEGYLGRKKREERRGWEKHWSKKFWVKGGLTLGAEKNRCRLTVDGMIEGGGHFVELGFVGVFVLGGEKKRGFAQKERGGKIQKTLQGELLEMPEKKKRGTRGKLTIK